MLKNECRKLFTVFFVVALSLFSIFSTACSSEAAKQKHLTRGEEYLQKRKYQEAAMEFRAAADLDKNSAEAHWGLARVSEKQGNMTETVSELRQTVALDPKNLEAKTKLGNYFLVFNPPQIPEAEKIVEEVLAADANFIEAYILKASILSVQNKPEAEIREVFEKALSLDPQRVESHLSLARFYMKLNKGAEAENAIKKAISVNEKSPLGYIEYGRFFIYTQRPNEAETQLKKAVEVAPQDWDALETLASFYVAQRQPEKAENAYKNLVTAQENAPEAKILLANFYSNAGRSDDAVRVYEEILKDAPEYARARYRLSEIYLERKETDKVSEQIEKLLAANDKDFEALVLRARLNILTNQTESAIKDLEEVLKKQPASISGLFYMTQARLALGQIAEARAFIGDLDRYHAQYLPTDLLKIQASLANGEIEQAVQQANALIERIKKTTPTVQMTAQDLEQTRVRAVSLRGQAHLALNKVAEARADLQEVLNSSPNSSSSLTNLAKVEQASGNLPQALAFYEKAFAADKQNFDALTGIVGVLKARNQSSQAHAKLDALLSENSGKNELSASLHYLKGDIYISEKNFPAAEGELQKAMELDENYLPAYSAYAALLVEQKQIERAVEQYKTIVDKKPSAAIYTVLGILEDTRENFNEAEKNYRRALEIAPDSPIAANNLAWLIAFYNRGNLDEALRLAQKAVDSNSSVAGFYDTLAMVYLKKGLTAPAIEQMKKAVSLDETESKNTGKTPNPGYRLRLGMALATVGDKPSARKEIETALKSEQNLSQKEAQEAKNLLSTL